MADALSRETDREDWGLCPSWFWRIDLHWGPHTINHFVSCLNRQLERFNTRWGDVGAEGVDAFAQANWPEENNWCNPPWSLLPRLVQLLQGLPSVRATVLAPHWPGAVWYRPLRALSSDSWILPRSPALFLPGRGAQVPRGTARWHVEAFRIDDGARTHLSHR